MCWKGSIFVSDSPPEDVNAVLEASGLRAYENRTAECRESPKSFTNGKEDQHHGVKHIGRPHRTSTPRERLRPAAIGQTNRREDENSAELGKRSQRTEAREADKARGYAGRPSGLAANRRNTRGLEADCEQFGDGPDCEKARTRRFDAAGLSGPADRGLGGRGAPAPRDGGRDRSRCVRLDPKMTVLDVVDRSHPTASQ